MTVHDHSAVLQPDPYKLRITDFLLLDSSGSFDSHAKTELLAGDIYYMNAQHRPHGRAKMRLYDLLRDVLATHPSSLVVAVEVSVALSEYDAPEPDLTLTTEPDGDGLIPGSSVALIIEVADSTLDTDLGRKATLYAAADVAEYWVVDVNGRVTHQFWLPDAGRYAHHNQVDFGSPLKAKTIGGLDIETSSL